MGALLHTDVEYVELGEHAGRRLRARVEHRTLRVALGRSSTAAMTLGRRRATAVEVTPTAGGASSGGPHDVAVPPLIDPWLQTAQRIAGVAIATWIIVRLAHRVRRRQAHEGAPQ